jgi:hypothetical protein
MTFTVVLRRAICGAIPLFLMLTLGGVSVAFAQAPDGNTLPSVVGRVSTVDGEIYRASTENAGSWDPISLNYPVTTGDNLWIAEGSRAEIDFGGGQMRAAGPTNVNVAQLDGHNLGLFVAEGRISVHVRVLDQGDTAVIDTPNTQVQITRPGLYDIVVSPDHGSTTLTVRQGNATALAANGPQPVFPGQRAMVSGTDTTSVDIRGSSPFDGFDSWVAQRDRLYEQNRDTAYVSREMVGYADLDQYGNWQNQPDMGPVWYPNTVAPGWTPYSDGFWTNTPGFGLTWVDAAPWGYAPFHYGRWAFVGSRWGWIPGTYVARPVWAPALVAWTGGNGWSVGISVGGPVYGWVPLGWREPFNPWWGGCGEGCWNNFNRPYQVNVTYNNFYRNPPPPSSFANWHVPGAVMAVPAAALASRAPLGRDRIALSPAALTAAPVLRQPVTIRPQVPPAQVLHVGTRGAPPPASTLYANSKPARMGLSPATGHLSTPGNGNAQGVPLANHGPLPNAGGSAGGSRSTDGVVQRGPAPAQSQAVGEPARPGNDSGPGPLKRGPANSGTGTPYPTSSGATNPSAAGNNVPKPGNGPTHTPKTPSALPGNGGPSSVVPGNGTQPNGSSAQGGYRVPGSESPPRSGEAKRDVQHAPPSGGAPNRNTYVPGAGPGGNGGGNPYVNKPPAQGAAPAHVEGNVPPRGVPNAVPENNRVANPPKSEPKNEPRNENKDKPKDKDK